MPTKTKKKNSASVKRPSVGMRKSSEDARIKLSKLVEKHKKTIQNLKSEISEQKSLAKSRDAIKAEVESLSETKEHLKVYVSQNSSKEKAFNKIIEDLTIQKSELDKYIDKTTPKKKALESELHELEKQKQQNLAELETFNSESIEVQSLISDLQQTKVGVESEIKELDSQYALYPRDMKNMSRDSKTQLKGYARLAGMSASATLLLTTFMLLSLFVTNPFVDQMTILFVDQPSLQFYSMLAITLVTIGAFSFLIYLFLNLTRSFVSQYINIRNRLTTLRVTDFLLTRMETSNGQSKTKGDKNSELTDLANKYIPEIMRFDNSFERKNKKS